MKSFNVALLGIEETDIREYIPELKWKLKYNYFIGEIITHLKTIRSVGVSSPSSPSSPASPSSP
jgi:hypothetical protein